MLLVLWEVSFDSSIVLFKSKLPIFMPVSASAKIQYVSWENLLLKLEVPDIIFNNGAKHSVRVFTFVQRTSHIQSFLC